MNKSALDILINRYEEHLAQLYNAENNELFKWQALRTFQNEWFSDRHPDFLTRFQAATKDLSVLIDTSKAHPRSGISKLWEKEPTAVEELFCRVLFAEDGGDLTIRQKHMEAFVDGMEQLRIKHYPAQWSYKMDRHIASVFLAMYAPAENYIYKYTEAEAMAVYTEFGFDLGSGAGFSLPNYHRMCEEITERLREHTSLLDAHFGALRPECYQERSLHLLTFDLIYCCRAYGYYAGIEHRPKSVVTGKEKISEKKKKEDEQKQARIRELAVQIDDLRLSLPDVSDISLLDVEVATKQYGVGTVVEHTGNLITVRFADCERKYILDKQFPMRPTFENDEEVVAAYSAYAEQAKSLKELEQQMEALLKQTT